MKLLPGLSQPTLPRPQKFGLVNNHAVARQAQEIASRTRRAFDAD